MASLESFVVRPAIVADLAGIANIRRCPQVQKNQYLLQEHSWWSFAEEAIRAESSSLRYHILEISGKTVGFVVMHCIANQDTQFGYVSFNLLPDLWGQGHMEKALRILFAEFFREEDKRGVMVECFSGNMQCRRLLQKLNFAQIPIPIIERLAAWFRLWPMRWVVRFWLSREEWRSL
jgi:RimJ/RimL family protein N-acetyltransferase